MGHLLGALGFVVADAREGFLALDALGDGGIGISDLYDAIYCGDSNSEAGHSLGNIVFMLDGFPSAQTGIIHLEDFVRISGGDISLPVAALANLGVVVQINSFVSIHNSYILNLIRSPINRLIDVECEFTLP